MTTHRIVLYYDVCRNVYNSLLKGISSFTVFSKSSILSECHEKGLNSLEIDKYYYICNICNFLGEDVVVKNVFYL